MYTSAPILVKDGGFCVVFVVQLDLAARLGCSDKARIMVSEASKRDTSHIILKNNENSGCKKRYLFSFIDEPGLMTSRESCTQGGNEYDL